MKNQQTENNDWRPVHKSVQVVKPEIGKQIVLQCIDFRVDEITYNGTHTVTSHVDHSDTFICDTKLSVTTEYDDFMWIWKYHEQGDVDMPPVPEEFVRYREKRIIESFCEDLKGELIEMLLENPDMKMNPEILENSVILEALTDEVLERIENTMFP